MNRRIRILLVAAVLPLSPATALPAGAAVAPTEFPPVLSPSVISATGSAAGLRVHVVPGQYSPSFDSAFVESFPYTAIAADSSPSASATAAPADMSVMDHYPDVACVFSIFAPYCPQIRQMPVDPYFASASSSYAGHDDAFTSFPCRPGVAEPPTSLIPTPSCAGAAADPPPLADGSVHTEAAPVAHALARLGPATLDAPAAALSGLDARLHLAHAILAATHHSTAGVDAAAAAGSVAAVAGTVVTSDVRVGENGVPVEAQSVVFHDLDVLGGLVHADALTLAVSAATLGEPSPRHAETVTFTGLRVAGTPYGDVDAHNCETVATEIDQGQPGAGVPGLSTMGFAFHCAHNSTRVDTGATGFGLDPIEQVVDGPTLEFAQPIDPLDVLRQLGVPVPQLCVAPGDTGLPSPPPSLGPLPLPGMPSSTCQFLSSNTFSGNGFSVGFGHVEQHLAAQPPLTTDTSFGPFLPGAAAPDLTTPAGNPGAPAIPGSPGTPGHPGELRSLPAGTAGSLIAQLARRGWLLFAYGAWEAATLATLLLGAAAIRRRRREGLL